MAWGYLGGPNGPKANSNYQIESLSYPAGQACGILESRKPCAAEGLGFLATKGSQAEIRILSHRLTCFVCNKRRKLHVIEVSVDFALLQQLRVGTDASNLVIMDHDDLICRPQSGQPLR